MVRRALIGLTALVGVASAQPVPNATWTLPSPRSVPTIEWSSNGQYVALSTSGSVEVLDASFKLKWARTVTSAQPSFLSYYNRPDRIHFSATGDSVYVKTGANSYTEYSTATGAQIRTLTFTDWTGDFVLSSVTTPTTGKMLVAIQVSVSGGVETLNLRSYDEATLALVSTKTLSHAYVPGVDIPIGRFRTRVGVGFYDKMINPSDGTVVDYDNVAGAGSEAWTIGFDADNGAVQQVVSSSAGGAIALRRIDAKGVQTWADTTQATYGPINFVKYGTVTSGLVGTGAALHTFDYLTGNWADYTGPSTVSFGPGAASKIDGRLVLTYSDSTGTRTDLFSTSGALTRIGTAVYQSGIGAIEPAANGLLVSGVNSYFGLFDQKNSNARWTGSGNPLSLGLTTSPTGVLAAAVYADRVDVLNSIDGTSAGSYTGVYKRAFWLNESRLVAVKADGSADLLNVASGSVTFVSALPVAFVAGGGTSNNGKFAIGYAGGKIHVFNTVNSADKTTDYPQFVSGWEKFFRIVSLADGRIAMLEKTTSGLKWQTYTISSGKIVADVAVPYTAPNAITGSTMFAGDLQGLSGGPVSAFFSSNGVDAAGTPISQLKLVRVSDQKVLATYDNAFASATAVRFSLDGSTVFVATGGSEDLGTEAIYALEVPAWLDRITGVASVPSGGTSSVTAYLANKAPASGATVDFSVSPTTATLGSASKPIAAYRTSAANDVTFPAVGTDTTYTFSASIPGSGESVSTTVLLKAPVPTTVTFASPTISGGQSTTGTVTMQGVAPAGGYTVTLASDDATVTIPATVTIAGGATSATFPISTQTHSRTIRPNITATANGTTATGQLRVNANTINLAVAPTTITAGGTATGTVTINVKTTKDVVIALESSSAGATVPATVTIPTGATSADFTVSTPSASTGSTPTISATYDSQVKTVALTVNQTPVSSLTLNPTAVPAGSPTTATITLGTTATSAVTVPLSYTGTGVTGPASVTIPMGATSADVTVNTTASLTGQTASVTATYGSSSKVANLTITSTQVTAFTVTNASIVGGVNSTGTITISAAAPTGGLTLTLANNKPSLIAAPATITVPAGATSVSFSWVTTPTLSSQTATYTATSGTSSKTATQTVVPPKVIGLTVSSSTVTGGTSITYTITLDGAAPAGFGVTVSSNNAALKVTSPVKFTTGVTSQAFTATTTTVTSQQTATLTASANGGTQTQTVTINP